MAEKIITVRLITDYDETVYPSLYAELKKKCDPQNFVGELYDARKASVANSLYSSLLALSPNCPDAELIELRNRAIDELDVYISTKSLFDELCEVCNPQQFTGQKYDGALFEKANAIFSRIKDNKRDIRQLEQIKTEAQEFYDLYASELPKILETKKKERMGRFIGNTILLLFCVGVPISFYYITQTYHSYYVKHLILFTVLYVIYHLLFSFLVSNAAENRRIKQESAFGLSLLLTPAIGCIITLCHPRTNTDDKPKVNIKPVQEKKPEPQQPNAATDNGEKGAQFGDLVCLALCIIFPVAFFVLFYIIKSSNIDIVNYVQFFVVAYLLIFAYFVGVRAIRRKLGFWKAFYLSFFLTPLIGCIIMLCSKTDPEAGKKREKYA
ncbi:MAG: hypothetical protein J6Y82_09930 [Bacteroidales bacterium]|nr:hypothetical protein [Bacteroidales bacterium]